MVSKRQLGVGFVLIGITAVISMFVIDALGAGKFQGIGPAQRMALIVAGVLILLGLSLVPLGDKPA